MMNLTCHEEKNRVNIVKHGISLLDASLLDWHEAVTWIDSRSDYGEIRYVSLATIGQRLYCVVYVELKASRRIISLRKANNREIDRYEEKNN